MNFFLLFFSKTCLCYQGFILKFIKDQQLAISKNFTFLLSFKAMLIRYQIFQYLQWSCYFLDTQQARLYLWKTVKVIVHFINELFFFLNYWIVTWVLDFLLIMIIRFNIVNSLINFYLKLRKFVLQLNIWLLWKRLQILYRLK